jgi:molybdate transport repressor ModE-like protein
MMGVQVRTEFWLEIDARFAVGQHGLELLQAIKRQRSLAAAARALGWSYRRAWEYLRRAERALGAPLVTVRAGKGRLRGMELSPLGRDVMRLGASLRVPAFDLSLRRTPSRRRPRRTAALRRRWVPRSFVMAQAAGDHALPRT